MRRSVAADMKAIFAPLPRPGKTAAESPPPPTEVAPPPKRDGARRWLLALLAVAILAALLSWSLVPKPQFASPARQAPQNAAPPVPAAAPLPATSQPVPTQPAAPAPAEAIVPASAQPVSSKTRESDLATTARKPAAPTRCSRYASQAWCLRRDITDADDRLRDTYEEAMRAGVDRRLMVAVRDDWERLRHRVNRDPRALIEGYAELNRELRAAIAGTP